MCFAFLGLWEWLYGATWLASVVFLLLLGGGLFLLHRARLLLLARLQGALEQGEFVRLATQARLASREPAFQQIARLSLEEPPPETWRPVRRVRFAWALPLGCLALASLPWLLTWLPPSSPEATFPGPPLRKAPDTPSVSPSHTASSKPRLREPKGTTSATSRGRPFREAMLLPRYGTPILFLLAGVVILFSWSITRRFRQQAEQLLADIVKKRRSTTQPPSPEDAFSARGDL